MRIAGVVALLLIILSCRAQTNARSSRSEQTHFSAEDMGVRHPIKVPDGVLAIIGKDEYAREALEGEGKSTGPGGEAGRLSAPAGLGRAFRTKQQRARKTAPIAIFRRWVCVMDSSLPHARRDLPSQYIRFGARSQASTAAPMLLFDARCDVLVGIVRGNRQTRANSNFSCRRRRTP
jgi:hypothetical protein